MVQYFGEQLDGFAFTRHGWVQSYGSRYVRPPIIYGDVARPHPMTRALGDLRPGTDRAAGEGDAHRAGDDPQLVVRPRRPAAGRDLPPDRPRHPRRGRRSRRGRDRRHPDRRAGAARRSAAAPRRPGGLSALGGGLLPAGGRRRAPGDPGPDPHVLQRVRRDLRRDRRPRRRRAARSSTPAPTRSCWRSSAPRATTRGSVPASTTSTARASRTPPS